MKTKENQEATQPGTLASLIDVYRTFGSHLKKYWPWFVFAYGAMATSVLLKTLTPFPLKWILDYVLLEKPLPDGRVASRLTQVAPEPTQLLALLCAAMVILVLLQSLTSFMQRYLLASAAFRANNDIRKHVFARLQVLPISFHGKISSGDLVVRLTNDINSLKTLLIDSVSDLLKMMFTFAWIAVFISMIDWQLTLMALVVAPPIYFFSSRFMGKVAKVTKVKRIKESQVGSIIQENINSMSVVQAFSQEDQEQTRFDRETDKSLRADLTRIQLRGIFGRAIDLMTALGTAFVIYYAGSRALGGQLEATDLILFVPWLKDLYSPMEKLAQLLVSLSRDLVCGIRIAEILKTEVTIQNESDAIEAPSFRGKVSFDNVTFGYKEDSPVLRDLSFTASPGQVVALVGFSGAGKSTVVNLLLRFFDPSSGKIEIDGTNIRNFTLESLRTQINVVLQDSPLFRRTIRENIAYGKVDATLEEVESAAKTAQIHDYVSSLPQGYDTMLDERGGNLSGGQRQRLGLARAILRDAPILILDEPVSGLDSVTAEKLHRTVHEVTSGKTTFIIAHSLSMIREADLILVLEEGKISEMGKHDDLMGESNLYRRLYETQYAPTSDLTSAESSPDAA
ncbi:ABC transporter ATP-binding protein/permease [Myxococcota bacterium]|nr:ABC transporter ATP-binding protein/permease [Myxococcota bacterium]